MNPHNNCLNHTSSPPFSRQKTLRMNSKRESQDSHSGFSHPLSSLTASLLGPLWTIKTWGIIGLNFKNTRTIDSNSLLSRSLNGHRNRWPSSSLKHIRLPIASMPKHRSRRTAQPGLCLCASAPFSRNPYEKPTHDRNTSLAQDESKYFSLIWISNVWDCFECLF